MKLKVIGTGSSGNAYLLENDDEILMIECGINSKIIKQALNWKLHKVVGCIVTHEHNDHAKSIVDVMGFGIDVYASKGTLEAKKVQGAFRAKTIEKHKAFKVGNFKILPFDVKHDAAEPLGFLIDHPDCGKVLFITDTYYCEYSFKGLNNIIVEANFSKEIIDQKLGSDSQKAFLRDRILQSHMSLENCCQLLSANDLTSVNNIVLIHLSDSNSDERMFKSEVEKLTGKTVTVASKGLEIEFNKTPF